MTYIIYNIHTTKILRTPAKSAGCWKERYATESAAKAALTRIAKKGKLGETRTPNPTPENKFNMDSTPNTIEDFAIAELSYFRENIELSIERTNAMTGEKFMEPLNANYATSPASETYWCS